MNKTGSGLRFSIKASWVPLHINGKLIAGRIAALHRIDERTFNRIDDRGRMLLQNLYCSAYGCLCGTDDARLTPVEFLQKNHAVYHAFFISYNTTIIVLGYTIFHYRYTELDPKEGIHIDYFSSVPVNYPDNIKPTYLGKYPECDTFYRVRGIGRATITLACSYANELHPGMKGSSIAVDLTARSDKELIGKRYVKDYGFEFYTGARGKGNGLFLNHTKARVFLKKYEDTYNKLTRPEGNGLTCIESFRR
ncbi:MAG: hypothetical protein A2W19_04140 [Spirochaetes bacterium RBG_16_49_21]|nr:MAG: hypothetical protein A2W19_04140 [Spirochaetes bacterium RBG_16_49_21]